MLSEITQDCRYALRQLGKALGFALTVVLTLVLSAGVATAVFCVIDTVILYGLITQEVEQGTRDIGVRMALGAIRARVLGMVMTRVLHGCSASARQQAWA